MILLVDATSIILQQLKIIHRFYFSKSLTLASKSYLTIYNFRNINNFKVTRFTFFLNITFTYLSRIKVTSYIRK